ncbi:MAG TPA: hypothetical protein VKP88_04400, partial [Candidatus Paceibacterota bacterium]|nr:hypothetical protein [Candidatus Paceibacterota bacterium]
RLGMRMTSGNQLKTARRSLNLLFLDWANRGLNLWTIEQAVLPIVQGDNEVALPLDTVNVLTAVIRDSSTSPSVDITIDRISRAEYLNVPNKTTEARPAQFYIERTNTPKVYLYPAADKSYNLVYYRIRRIQDAGDYTNTTDVNFRFLPCMVAGLSYYLSLKFAPDRVGALKQIYEEEFARAAAEDRDTASFFIVPDVGY